MADIIIKLRAELQGGKQVVYAVPQSEEAKSEFLGFTESDGITNHYGFFLSDWEDEIAGALWLGLTVAMEDVPANT